MHMHSTIAWLLAPLLTLCACGAPADRTDPVSNDREAASDTVPTASSRPAATPSISASMAGATPAAPLSCLAEIGAAAAARRVAVCRDVSPATRPPCNAANSCALIEDEIARSCALFDGDAPPMKRCGPDPKGMEAAANVVRRYYSAINARDYDTAWTQWGDGGRPGQTFAAFAAGFARTRSTRVTVGKLEPGGGGAGSIYQPVPVTVEATLDDGTRQRFSGTYVARRVNDVDGASASKRRWHIDSAQLRRVPVG